MMRALTCEESVSTSSLVALMVVAAAEQFESNYVLSPRKEAGMGDIVKVLFERRWGAPVTVSGGSGPGTQITGPAEALSYFRGWSHQKTVLYEAAVLTCREAVLGQAPLRRSRELFVAACKRAC
ncbi:hypothetical protein DEM27_32790 [Metarhizobium album]|uniref:DUF982 domain-containing protein n=2 Tax=Metarhizobium album TaxID=2182425 RepID=A0A2U2DFL9_9HYPH|nr:hypothetical protein DEM27_32790 [Rhizobium album]